MGRIISRQNQKAFHQRLQLKFQEIPNLSTSKIPSRQYPLIQRKWKSLNQNNCLKVKAGKLQNVSLGFKRHFFTKRVVEKKKRKKIVKSTEPPVLLYVLFSISCCLPTLHFLHPEFAKVCRLLFQVDLLSKDYNIFPTIA